MKEYIAFIKDSKFWIPVLILVGLEIGMQFGCYRPFLKKNSYAANVSRITNHVLEKQKNLIRTFWSWEHRLHIKVCPFPF